MEIDENGDWLQGFLNRNKGGTMYNVLRPYKDSLISVQHIANMTPEMLVKKTNLTSNVAAILISVAKKELKTVVSETLSQVSTLTSSTSINNGITTNLTSEDTNFSKQQILSNSDYKSFNNNNNVKRSHLRAPMD